MILQWQLMNLIFLVSYKGFMPFHMRMWRIGGRIILMDKGMLGSTPSLLHHIEIKILGGPYGR